MTPIETEYQGVKFRSRTEARWAMVFNSLNIKWLYEPEGFDLPEVGRYVPDFFLPDLDSWFEVKGPKPTEDETEKCCRLACASNKRVFIAYGFVSTDYRIMACHADGWVDEEQYAFCQCPACLTFGIEFCGKQDRIGCGCSNPFPPHPDTRDTIAFALGAAERHRFWDPPAPEPKAPRSRVLESLNRMCKNERAKSFAAKRTHLTPK